AEHDIGLVIVDYLQLMHGTSQTQGNREQEIAQISRSLKGLAKELNVPVIALAQLSRAVETRGGDKRPQLSDLRESGSIEQDADVVMFIYRAERYGITVDEAGNSTEGLGELLIGKQRNGPIGDVKVAFVNQFARFENLTSYVASDTDGGYGEVYGQDAYGQLPPAGSDFGDPYGGPPPLGPPPDFGPPDGYGLPPSSADPF
ncbi:MAG TPA: DnaB-like helicase C-terminal domain-containing protein, partial [Rubricoccaceae bacterium]